MKRGQGQEEDRGACSALASWAPIGLATFAATASSVLIFPGFMSFDSFYVLRQSLDLTPINDYHPVIWALVWRGLMAIARTPGVLLVFDQALYWSAVTLFAFALASRGPTRAALIAGVGFVPPMYIIALHLWPDAQMLGALTLTVAALAADLRRPHPAWLLIACLALLYGAMVRENAVFALPPLGGYLAWRVAGAWRAVARRRARATLLILGAILSAFAASLWSLDRVAVHESKIGYLLVWDLAAISVARNQDLIPPYLARTGGDDFLAALRARFNPDLNIPIFAVVSPVPPKGDTLRLVRDWLNAIRAHPRAYLRHRWHVFATLIGLRPAVYYPFHYPGIDRNTLGIGFAFPGLYRSVIEPTLFVLAALPFYRIWLYLLIGLGLVAGSLDAMLLHRLRGERLVLMLAVSASGITMQLPLFLIAPAADFRYSIWLVAASVLSGLIGLREWVDRRRRSDRQLPARR